MKQEIIFLLLILVLGVSQISAVSGLRQSIRRLEKKLDALMKHQGIEIASRVSPEARLIAQDPGRMIAAIKLHREQNPDLSLSEAKKDIEDCLTA